MAIEIRIPSVGESVKEAVLAQWFKKEGEWVHREDPLFVIETDKVTLEVTAETDGVLHIQVAAGTTVPIGAVVGALDTAAAGQQPLKEPPPQETETPATETVPTESAAPPPAEPKRASEPLTVPAAHAEEAPPPEPATAVKTPLAPSVRRLAAERQVDLARISGTGPGGRVTKGDVLLFLEAAPPAEATPPLPAAAEVAGAPETTRKPMSPIRQRIAARLLTAKQNTAMLTTFNEIDMQRLQEIRAQYRETFQKAHGVSLGMMSFFIKAAVEALKEFPELNAFIDGPDIVYNHGHHIGIAVGAERGLVVPVVRHAETLSFARLEQAIVDYVAKIKSNRLELTDLEGGTFTISNGGVYGSLLSTPILNMPQSGILGMHKIEKRPVVIDDQVVIRPMMYVALSYDHRIVDGREAVTFLKRIKTCIENPERIMLEI